jgi:3-oxoacyl-[acyl-carrier-protein] synthase III
MRTLERAVGVGPGLGTALPARVVTNAEVAARIGVDETWILRRTGIESRRHVSPGESIVELAAAAGASALADAGLTPAAIDLVLVATSAGDDLIPATAPQVAAALGTRTAAFDVGAACTGFVAGLSVAAAFVDSGRAEHVLLIGADTLSRQTDAGDRKTAMIFGDGAGAIVVSAGTAVGPVVLASDGTNADLIVAPHGGKIQMDGHATFVEAVRALSEVTPQAVRAAGLTLDDIDLFVFHQANRRILQAVCERLALPVAKVVDAISEVGNTSAASLPLALEQARRDGRLEPGSRVLLGAVGAGFAWGAGVLQW